MHNDNAVQALLFDLGGVVMEIDFNLAFAKWSSQASGSFEELTQSFCMDSAYEQHERGEIDAAEYFSHLRCKLNLDGDNESIAAGWNSLFIGEIKSTLDEIKQARKYLPCYAFTNSNPTHQIYWTAHFPNMIASFDHIFVSSEMGMRKPERRAFDKIAQETGVALSSMLFFDDTLENIEGAQSAGLQAVHVRSPADVTNALITLGVLTAGGESKQLR